MNDIFRINLINNKKKSHSAGLANMRGSPRTHIKPEALRMGKSGRFTRGNPAKNVHFARANQSKNVHFARLGKPRKNCPFYPSG